MTVFEISLLVISLIFVIAGFVGILFPAIPGLPFIWFGVVIYAMGTSFESVSILSLIIITALMIIGTVLDFVSGIYGARRFGASWYGVLGSMIFGMIGLIIFNLFGFILGTFCGALVGEFVKHKKTKRSMIAGIGTMIGLVCGAAIKILIAFLMIIIFLMTIFL